MYIHIYIYIYIYIYTYIHTGDTGPAAIRAVKGLSNLGIICFYPFGQISTLQELQVHTFIRMCVCVCVYVCMYSCSMWVYVQKKSLPALPLGPDFDFTRAAGSHTDTHTHYTYVCMYSCSMSVYMQSKSLPSLESDTPMCVCMYRVCTFTVCACTYASTPWASFRLCKSCRLAFWYIHTYACVQMTTVNSPNVCVYSFEGGGDDMDVYIYIHTHTHTHICVQIHTY